MTRAQIAWQFLLLMLFHGSADPSKHGRAHGNHSIHARTTISLVWNIRFLEASDSQSIQGCQLENIWFLEASDSQSIQGCQLENIWFLEASDSKSIHGCQLRNIRLLDASESNSMRGRQPGNIRFLETSDSKSICGCQLRNIRFLEESCECQCSRQHTNVRFRFSAGTCLATLVFPRQLEFKLSMGLGKASSLL